MNDADADSGDKYRTFPLRLCEVLENEFVALRDLLPLAPNWLLRREDVCLEELVNSLWQSIPHPTMALVYAVRERLETEDAKVLASAALALKTRKSLLAMEAQENQKLQELQEKARKIQKTQVTQKVVIPVDQEAYVALKGQEVEVQKTLHALKEKIHGETVKVRKTTGALLKCLNTLLEESADLYDYQLLDKDSEAFQLAELRRKVHHINKDEQTLLNRLLLEAALPETVINRVDKVRRARLFKEIHGQKDPPKRIYSALCLSGGGIRSGAFALGAMQGLARHGILEKFDFLSTVSGGGYAGSWLSTWIHRHPQGLDGVISEMKADRSPAGGMLGAEPAPIGFLRTYSHFLNPRAGLFSGDTWTWIGIYLRNLLLNWLIIIPALLLLMMLPRVYGALMWSMRPLSSPASIPALYLLVSLVLVSTLVCIIISRPSLRDISSQAGGTGRTPVQGRFSHLLSDIKQQRFILRLGIVSFLLFSILSTLIAWVLAEKPEMDSARSGFDQFLLDTSRLGFWHIAIWGMSVMALAWAGSMCLLPKRDLLKRFKELLVMLVTGGIAWLMIAKLLQLPAIIRNQPRHHFPLSPCRINENCSVIPVIDPAHLYAILAPPVVASVTLIGMTLFIGAISRFNWIEDEDREWWGRFGGWALVGIVVWLALSTIAIVGPPLLLHFLPYVATLGGISGLVALLFGKSSLTAATLEKSLPVDRSILNKFFGMAGINMVAALSAVFLVAFLAFVSLLGSALLTEVIIILKHWADRPFPTVDTWLMDLANQDLSTFACFPPPQPMQKTLDHLDVFACPQLHLDLARRTSILLILLTGAVLFVVVSVANHFINLNKFSLHAAYRIRIIRTFLGASRQDVRQPNTFTGFDPLDNIHMHELQPGLLRDVDIDDLDGFITKLHLALVSGVFNSPAGALAKLMCAPQRDRSGVLRSRLKSHDPDEPVLKSLQRDLLQSINRVLQTVRLSEVKAFEPKEKKDVERTDWYVVRGNLIFANRRLIEVAFPEHIKVYKFPPPPPHKLLQVINLTLNLVRGKNLAWQERKAAPFSVSPLHAGSYYLGYRSSRDYGGENGITLGTAAAISGAAVSPAMGYSSSPVTALLMALFNVRLGWWLGNPGTKGHDTYRESGPRNSFLAILSEALGLTDDKSPYVYLSDGGHFENLGLFEMVQRRCHLIVVCDATSDPDYRFCDLGNAVRKIRIDLGIPITFDTMPIHKYEPGDDTGRYCAIGKICYSLVDGEGTDGTLIYFKPVLCGSEPRDIQQYRAQNPEFPQEGTMDQFFGESQFESYRHLGAIAVDTVLKRETVEDTFWHKELISRVHAHLEQVDSRKQ